MSCQGVDMEEMVLRTHHLQGVLAEDIVRQILSFDLDEIERGCESAQKKGGIEASLLKRYRDRKAMAKQHFINNGGYADEERARANPLRACMLRIGRKL
ncbi:hypothetical protein R6Q57_016359 [Mikania cordata]